MCIETSFSFSLKYVKACDLVTVNTLVFCCCINSLYTYMLSLVSVKVESMLICICRGGLNVKVFENH